MSRFVITTRELRHPAARHAPIPAYTIGLVSHTHPSGLVAVDFGPHGTRFVWPQALHHLHDEHGDLGDYVGEELVGYATRRENAA